MFYTGLPGTTGDDLKRSDPAEMATSVVVVVVPSYRNQKPTLQLCHDHSVSLMGSCGTGGASLSAPEVLA